MTTAKTFFVALSVGATAAAFASQAPAQVTVSPERAAAIHRCIAEAQRLYPGPSLGTDRSDFYMACMTQAGFTP
jgi:hypothetical protein